MAQDRSVSFEEGCREREKLIEAGKIKMLGHTRAITREVVNLDVRGLEQMLFWEIQPYARTKKNRRAHKDIKHADDRDANVLETRKSKAAALMEKRTMEDFQYSYEFDMCMLVYPV